MTADELIANCGQNRTGTSDKLPEPAMLREFLEVILSYVLDGLDYEGDSRSSQAVGARCLAAMICTVDDVLGKEVLQ
jgi:hypothetical protein